MGTHQALEKHEPANGFLRFRFQENTFYDQRYLPPIMRSEYRDVWAWKDTTGQRFRRLQTHVQDKDFVEKSNALYHAELHPLSSLDRVLYFDINVLIEGIDMLQKSNH